MPSKYPLYKLVESPFELVAAPGVVFRFSTEYNRKRFMERAVQYVDEQEYRLRLRYKVQHDFRLFLLIVFYTMIEKRGFYAVIHGEVFDSWQQVQFDGVIKTNQR